MKIQTLSRIMMIILLIALVLSCAPKTDDKTEVNISVPQSISSLPVSATNNKIINGKTIKIGYFQDHIMSMAEFITGKVDILMTGYSQGAAAAETNSEIVHLATIVWGVSSLVTKDPGIRELKDLSEKSISVPFQNSPLDLQMKAILKKAGLSDSIRLEYNPVQQSAALLIENRIVSACLPEPLTTLLVSQKGLYSPFTIPGIWEDLFGYKNTPQVSLFAKKTFINKNKKFVDTFLSSIGNNIRSIPALTEEQKTQFAREVAIPVNLLARSLSNTIFGLFAWDEEIHYINTYQTDIEVHNTITKDFFYTHE
ncbi:MAG: ABC transporter substrate-binding protein [Spirochaetales bacterium]|nr:ABC transporter substrate-binding protein [Spirochaetales bacterium]